MILDPPLYKGHFSRPKYPILYTFNKFWSSEKRTFLKKTQQLCSWMCIVTNVYFVWRFYCTLHSNSVHLSHQYTFYHAVVPTERLSQLQWSNNSCDSAVPKWPQLNMKKNICVPILELTLIYILPCCCKFKKVYWC